MNLSSVVAIAVMACFLVCMLYCMQKQIDAAADDLHKIWKAIGTLERFDTDLFLSMIRNNTRALEHQMRIDELLFTHLHLKELAESAKAVAHPPWLNFGYNGRAYVEDASGIAICHECHPAVAEYIAAIDPDVILSWIAEIEDRPIVWAIQNRHTKSLLKRGDTVELYDSKESAEANIQSGFLDSSVFAAVIFTGKVK